MKRVKSYEWNERDLLGQGGFGSVYKCNDLSKPEGQRECAIKLMDYN